MLIKLVGHTGLSNSQLKNHLCDAIISKNRKYSTIQTIKGVVSSGISKSVFYAAHKYKKRTQNKKE